MKAAFLSFGVSIFTLLILPGFAFGQSVNPDKINKDLAAGSPASLTQALADIRTDLAEEPRGVINNLCGEWLKKLYEADRFDDVETIARQAIQTYPLEAPWLYTLQRYRVLALLKLNKPVQALECAKSLFNVCPMHTTGSALLLLGECLNANHPNDLTIVDRLVSEQEAGEAYAIPPAAPATAAASSPSSAAAMVPARTDSAPGWPDRLPPVPDASLAKISPLLQNIHVDPAVYDEAIKSLYGTSYVLEAHKFRDLCGKGNLLLLADRPREAEDVFREALAMADDTERLNAREAVARALRAEDGTVGRANAWVKEIREQDP